MMQRRRPGSAVLVGTGQAVEPAGRGGTILTTGRKPLTEEEVVSPLEAAFDDPSQGGCADP